MSKDEYLITDAPLKALTVFAMPMILGSFFQQVYNMADSIIRQQQLHVIFLLWQDNFDFVCMAVSDYILNEIVDDPHIAVHIQDVYKRQVVVPAYPLMSKPTKISAAENG